MNESARVLGLEMVRQPQNASTYQDLTRIVYQRLLKNPALQNGPIGLIIMDTISPYYTMIHKPQIVGE